MTDKFNPWALVPRSLKPFFFDDDFFSITPLGSKSEGLNLYETDDEVVVEAPVPGVPADKVSVSIEGGVLTIKAASQEQRQEEDKKKRWYLKGYRQSQFFYQVQLPAKVDGDKTQAEVENGLLRVKLPKVEAAKSKTIKVKVK